jgi:hypothetical protein
MVDLALPTAARIVMLTENLAQLRGQFVPSMVPSWPAKDPSDTIDLAADFSFLTGGVVLDSIVALSSGCVITTHTLRGTVAVLRIIGGVDGTPGIVSITASYGGGQVRTKFLRMPVVAQAPTLVGGGASPPPVGGDGHLFVYTQSSASAIWVIVHNLNRDPAIVVADSAGTLIEGDIHFDSLNQVTITFSAAFAGVAYLQ